MNNAISARGFTLVETVAAIGVLGALSAVAAPIGGQIQAVNLDTKSQWVHHGLARRQLMYVNDHNGAFTGPNTSGGDWNREPLGNFSNPGIETLEFDTDGSNPTTQGDWITPLVGAAYGLSANRAERMQQMFEMTADPTTTRYVDSVYGLDEVDDAKQFAQVLQNGGIRQRSFLQMRSFTHLDSTRRSSNLVSDFPNDILYREHFAVQHQGSQALNPKGYTPRIWNVGTQTSNKVMFADGTRYVSSRDGLSLDARLYQGTYVDDSSSGPIFGQSAAYGREYSGTSKGENLDLSYRKQGGEGLYVTMFDGSTQYMTREQTWTDPTPWFPSGSVWTGVGATQESAAWMKKNLQDGVIH